jgi:type III secretion system FlhB-like substrate exporter
LAKGKGEIAERIVEVAIVHGVPIVRREELARALYLVVEVGEEIPPKFYRAVAEVIAFVLSRRRRIAAEAVLKNPSLGRPPASKGTNPFLTLSHAPLQEERSILLSRTGKRRVTFRTCWAVARILKSFPSSGFLPLVPQRAPSRL